MVLDLHFLIAALPHLISGLTLTFVFYIARMIRLVYQVYKKLPQRMHEAETKIGEHETRIIRLEVPVAR